jgi:hypothetical protein
MAKEKEKKSKKAKVKVAKPPKHIAGMKLPKPMRKPVQKAMELANSPKAGAVAAAVLLVAAEVLNKARKPARPKNSAKGVSED